MQVFKWCDYNYEKYYTIDSWNNDSEYGDIINKYAMFDEPLSTTFKWYSENTMGKIKDVIKVVEENDNIIGFIILNISMNLKNDNLLIGINPIVINPSNLGNGYGKKVLLDLINNYVDIIKVGEVNYHSVIFTAGADESNSRCINMLLDLGFIKTGIHEDGTFGYYEKRIKK